MVSWGTFALIVTTAVVATPMGNARWMVHGVRVKLFPEEEPSTEQMYRSFRIFEANRHYWSLNFANISAEPKDEDQLQLNDLSFERDFKFNSSEFQQIVLNLMYFVPYDQRTSLQVYDVPEERQLATGPRVDQEACGHHLDYMNSLSKLHGNNVMNVSELSIFRVINTIRWPGFGQARGNNYLLGDYQGCTDTRLNVMRTEMSRLNKTGADWYFSEDKFLPQPAEHPRAIQWILDNLGPFFGKTWLSKHADMLILRRKDQLRAVPMRYCMAGFRWPNWRNSSHLNRNVVLRVGICLPETCDSNSLAMHGDKIKHITDMTTDDHHSGYYINDLYCLPDEKSQLRNPFNYLSTIYLIVFNIIWIGLTILALVISSPESSNLGKYLNCWSVKRNVEDFFSGNKSQDEDVTTDSRQQTKVNLDPIEGLKSLGAFLVICAHVTSIYTSTTWNPDDGRSLNSNSYFGFLMTICPTSVDIFFTLTGVLTMYVVLERNRKSLLKPTFWIGFIVYRYIRIVPMYALIHWFLSSGFRFIDSGPLWDYGTSNSAWSKTCQNESWWEILLPQANFKSPAKTCNAVGWYMANDIQFTLITPIFVVLYATKPRLAHLVTGCSILLLTINHIAYYLPFSAGFKNIFQWDCMSFTSVFTETSGGYTRPEYRVVSHLVGLTTGYVLHKYARTKGSRWSRWFVFSSKLFIFLSIYLISFIPYISTSVPLDNEYLVNTLSLAFLGTMHLVSSLCVAVFILLVCTGHMPILSTILSWTGFKYLSNVSLSVVLIQLPVILNRMHSMTALPGLTPYALISRLIMLSLEIYLLGTIVYIVYEVPLRRFLLKFLLSNVAHGQQNSRREREKKIN